MPRGRPTKLCPKVTEQIIDGISIGAYIETAAGAAGLNRDTFHRWLREGARDAAKGRKTPLAKFAKAIDKAMHDAHLKDLNTISTFAKGFPIEKHFVKVVMDGKGKVLSREERTETTIRRSWEAAAWKLERKYAALWGRKYQMAGHDGGPLVGRIAVELPDNKRKDAKDKKSGKPSS